MNWIIIFICSLFVLSFSVAFVYLFIKSNKQNITLSSEVSDLHEKLNNLVNNINNSQYYEYTFDKQQEKNIKHVDTNVEELEKAVKDLQASVMYLYNNLGTFLQRPNSLCIDNHCLTTADIAKLKNLR